MPHTFAAIVPNYNDSKSIGESLASLRAQHYPFNEIIIVDDCSTDNSVDVINNLIADWPQARLVRNEKNLGVVGALNVGIAQVKSDYLFLCSANDTYYPQMVAWCEEMLKQYPNAGIVSGNVAAWNEEKKKFDYAMRLPLPQTRTFYTPQELVVRNRKVGIHFNGGANALRTELVREFGGLQAPLKWHSDWFLNLMCGFRTGVAYVPENFSMCRLEGKKSYSSGRFDWNQEKEIIRFAIQTLKKYPQEAELFRQSALLPKYDLKGPKLLMDNELRWFITPLLIWRMVMHSLTYRSKMIVPRPILMYFRPFFRV